MQSLISKLSGRGGDRGDFVTHCVANDVDKVLDVGCAYGWALSSLSGRARELVGIDMDEAALTQARENYPHIRFIHQTAAELPFPSDEFDVVILSEVIEHVGDENKTLVIDEAWRVLKDDGLFIFTAPYAGIFAWADPMDFKRRFPGIYRFYMRLTRYTPDTPIEVGHKHVSLEEINFLFRERFTIEEIRHSGLLTPFVTWTLSIDSRAHVLPRRVHQGLNRFRGWESGVQYPSILSFNVRLLARKRSSESGAA